MKDSLEICSHCSRTPKGVRLSSDIGVLFHWKGDYFLVDVVLFVEGSQGWLVLYREAYVVESKNGEV